MLSHPLPTQPPLTNLWHPHHPIADADGPAGLGRFGVATAGPVCDWRAAQAPAHPARLPAAHRAPAQGVVSPAPALLAACRAASAQPHTLATDCHPPTRASDTLTSPRSWRHNAPLRPSFPEIQQRLRQLRSQDAFKLRGLLVPPAAAKPAAGPAGSSSGSRKVSGGWRPAAAAGGRGPAPAHIASITADSRA